MNTFRTEIITQIEENFIQQWTALWERAENANVFNSYEYFLSDSQLYKEKKYLFFTCWRDDELVAVLPLEPYSLFGVTVWGTISKSHLVDTPFLMERYDKELVKHFFDAIFKKNNIFLQKVDSKAASLLHGLYPQLFISLMSVNPTIPVDDLMTSVSPSTIKQIKKIIRKNPELQFTMYHDNLEKHLRTMIKLEQQSTKRARSMDIFSKKEHRDFYEVMVKNCSKLIRICFLYINGEPIAYQYGYWYKDRFACDQIAFRSEYSKLRPGKTILFYLMEHFKNSAIKLMDLGGGISNYKSEFTDDYRVLYNIHYSPNTAVMAWWKMINKARRQKQQLFPLKNTRDHEFLFRTFSALQ